MFTFKPPFHRYRHVVDVLLFKHEMEVPPATRDLLAGVIMNARRRGASGVRSPKEQAEQALCQARRVRQYLGEPLRKDSIRKWCSKLHETLGASYFLYICLATELDSERVKEITQALEAGSIDAKSLDVLIGALSAIVGVDWKTGRPRSIVGRAVTAGCIAWIGAGNPELGYTQNPFGSGVTGTLPDFLRDLGRCCDLRFKDPNMKRIIQQCVNDPYFWEAIRKNT